MYFFLSKSSAEWVSDLWLPWWSLHAWIVEAGRTVKKGSGQMTKSNIMMMIQHKVSQCNNRSGNENNRHAWTFKIHSKYEAPYRAWSCVSSNSSGEMFRQDFTSCSSLARNFLILELIRLSSGSRMTAPSLVVKCFIQHWERNRRWIHKALKKYPNEKKLCCLKTHKI